MKTIKLKENCLLPGGHGQSKHAKKGATVTIDDATADRFIARKLAEEVKPAKAADGPADAKPLDKPALLAMSKADLLALATKSGIVADDKNTKDQIADAILSAPPAK